MDFSRPHILQESVASKSKIRYIDLPAPGKDKDGNEIRRSLDERLVDAANKAAQDLLLGSGPTDNPSGTRTLMDASLYPDRLTPESETIQAGALVVIFESFDNLNFVYATPGEIFSNRNGNFHHNDFIGQPFGCKLRSKDNRGYGYCYLLKPTPELWARSLNHRTQIVHELDASMIVFYLNLRPNMVVCETGTGSGAMSHAILRTIAPFGKLHTFEFNKQRADQARQEFAKNGLSHLVNVYHKDVCGKAPVTPAEGSNGRSKANDNEPATHEGGFGLEGQSVEAIFLDLPEPWLAIPHAAFCLKPNGRIASYSPCIEQTQQTCIAMQKAGFHSLRTMEFRLRENYVDDAELEPPPKEKRQRTEAHHTTFLQSTLGEAAMSAVIATEEARMSGGEDTGAEADNEMSQISETDAASLGTAGEEELPAVNQHSNNTPSKADENGKNNASTLTSQLAAASSSATTTQNTKRRKVLVARPFVTMRGHTAFLTFATAGNVPQPDPNATI